MGTSAAARVVLHLPGYSCLDNVPRTGNASCGPPPTGEGGIDKDVKRVWTETTGAEQCDRDGDDLERRTVTHFRVPKGLWCYRLDRNRIVLGGALTDGGSVLDWLRGTLGITDQESLEMVMREAQSMKPASHDLVVSVFCLSRDYAAFHRGTKANTACTEGVLVRSEGASCCFRRSLSRESCTLNTAPSELHDTAHMFPALLWAWACMEST